MGRELIREALERHYKVDDTTSQQIVQQIIADRTSGKKPVDSPSLIVLGAQPGAGKTTMQHQVASELEGNVVICDMDDLRGYHPRTSEMLRDHEGDFGEITNPSVGKWSSELARYCRENRYNFVVESSCSDPTWINDDVKLARSLGYQTNLKILAVDPRLSLIGIQFRYEMAKLFYGAARSVPKELHDHCARALPGAISHLHHAGHFHAIDIYARTIVVDIARLEEGATRIARNPADPVQVYREEVSRTWSPELDRFVDEKTAAVVRLMEKRKAPEREIDDFRRHIGSHKGHVHSQRQTGNLRA